MISAIRRARPLLAALGLGMLTLQATAAHAQAFNVTNLVSDGYVPAATIDASLINPWGVSYFPGNPFWVSDNNAGVSTLYDGTGAKIGLTVNIPPPAGKSGGGTSTGQVANTAGHGFAVTSGGKTGSSAFIFDTEDGTISGWAPSVDGTNAILAVDNSRERAVYKGLANGTKGVDFLYATNFRAGDVEIYNSKWVLVKTFTDPTVPAGYAPYNVQNLGGTLYVTFAKQNPTKHDSVSGPGWGYVDAFNLNGTLQRRVVSRGWLNAPWGLDLAPASFGAFAGDLLVGNFGDGKINVYDPATGAWKGQLSDASGKPLKYGNLWALINGGGGSSGDPNIVYFTAGLYHQAHGLFGAISLASGGARPKGAP